MIEIIEGVFVRGKDIKSLEIKYHETPSSHYRLYIKTEVGDYHSEHSQENLAKEKAIKIIEWLDS